MTIDDPGDALGYRHEMAEAVVHQERVAQRPVPRHDPAGGHAVSVQQPGG
jgi:hypothetical protein